MENINIKVILDEVFGKSCNNIACDTCKRMLVMMKFMLNLNVEKQINLLNNPT